LTHLKLTGIALLLGCLVAIPLALLLSRYQRASRALLYLAGLIQTIPALALLALMIPLVGLGELTAILALFLYSLLPIVRNTLTGIFSVDPLVKQVATGMGLTPLQQLLRIELPLATPTLLAGIKTAAIISIGTATLAAFVGAGGLGEPIISGLSLNDHTLILEGAVPAALLAVVTELAFEWLERVAIPAHLRQT
jgi:osmoprotectant transport system permease protein